MTKVVNEVKTGNDKPKTAMEIAFANVLNSNREVIKVTKCKNKSVNKK